MPRLLLGARLLRTGGGPWRPPSSLATLGGPLADAGRASDFARQALLARWASSLALYAQGAPKKPASSWILFLGQYRKEHPEVTGKEVLPAASAVWQALSEEEKAPWVQQHATGKVRYDAWRAEAAVKASRPRDPERPKKPRTSFFRFLKDFRARHPEEKKGPELTKRAGAAWEALSAREKQPYEDAYAADKRAHDAEMERYVQSGKAATWKAAVAPPAARDPQRPKAPATPYLRFAQDFRKRHPDEIYVTELAKKAGAEWRALSERERQPYVDAYAADKVAYQAAVGRYVQSGKAVNWQVVVSPRKRDPEKPKAPTPPYFRFLRDFRKRHPDVKNVKELATKASAEWKALTEREKQPYEDAYAADKTAYKAAKKEYVQSGKAAAWKERVSPPTRDPERPKVPQTAYRRFLQDFRKKHPDVKDTAKAKAEWRFLAEREKQPYLDAHAADKAAYQLALQEYVRSGKDAAWKEEHAQVLAGKQANTEVARRLLVVRAQRAQAAAGA